MFELHVKYLMFFNVYTCLVFGNKPIEIMNNSRAGIKGKIWERDYWGGKSAQKYCFSAKKTFKQ